MDEVMQIDSPVTPYSYMLYECHSCASRFFNHSEHDVSLAELYDDLAKHRAHFPVEFTPKPYWQNQKNILINLLGKEPESILDVGARTGDFLLHFDESIHRTGVEVSNYFCEIARKRGLTMHEAFLEDITFENKFQIVSSYAIMEHLKDPVKFLDILQAIVKKGGILVIMVPTHQSLKARFLQKKWHMYSPPEHLNFYSRRMLDEYLLDKGFTLQKRYYSIGGMFKPFRNVPGLKKIHRKIPGFLDALPLIKKIPVYDHMFSYYKRDYSLDE